MMQHPLWGRTFRPITYAFSRRQALNLVAGPCPYLVACLSGASGLVAPVQELLVGVEVDAVGEQK